MKKRFMVALYDDNKDLLELFDISSTNEVIAVVRAVKRKDRDAYNAYIEFLDEIDEDLGTVACVKEFFHEWMSIAVKEIE